MKNAIVTVLMGVLVPGSLLAHAVWVEKEKGIAKAYFGEWGDDKREVAGKVLDYIKGPKAFLGPDKTPLTLTKETNHFAAPVSGAGDVRVIEASLKAVASKSTGVRTKGVYIAKYGRTETKAAADLELVPAAANGNSFTLMLNGAPLPKAEIHVFGPPRWQKIYFTDDQGKLTIETPWAGPYLMEAVYIHKAAGGTGEDAYDQTRFVTTVFFETAKGIRWK